MEPYSAAAAVVPRVLRCGHEFCEACLDKKDARAGAAGTKAAEAAGVPLFPEGVHVSQRARGGAADCVRAPRRLTTADKIFFGQDTTFKKYT